MSKTPRPRVALDIEEIRDRVVEKRTMASNRGRQIERDVVTLLAEVDRLRKLLERVADATDAGRGQLHKTLIEDLALDEVEAAVLAWRKP